MPNPRRYKDKSKFMQDCMHQTLKVEGKPQDQSVAMCLNMWRNKDKEASSEYGGIDFYRDDSYGPEGNVTVFYSTRNHRGEEGVFLIAVDDSGENLKFIRVRTSFTIFKKMIASGKVKPVSVEEVKKYLTRTKQDKIAGRLLKQIEMADLSKKPIVFLGGLCKDNAWREELKKEFSDKFFFLDPFDPDWELEDNVYEELAGIVDSDYVILYKGGKGTANEKKYMKLIDKDYESFKDLEDVKSYLRAISKGNKKLVKLSSYLYKMSADLMLRGLYRTRIADDLYGNIHKEKEKRVVLNLLPEECKGVDPIIIKQGVLKESKKDGDVISYARIRMKKEPGKDAKYSLGVKNFRLNEEAEAEISKQTFDSFYPDFLERPQEKKRYKLSNGWEVDDLGNEIIAEFELGGKHKYEIPKDWDVKEVKKYKEASSSFSSVQINIPLRIANKIKELGKSIPKEELADDGLEKETHITVLYGILSDTPDQVKTLLKSVRPFSVTVMDRDVFISSATHDVVIHKINSIGLHRLNRLLRNNCPYRATYPDYNPHSTVAYVKKGYGPKYVGKSFSPMTFLVSEVIFSSKNGKKVKIRLGS